MQLAERPGGATSGSLGAGDSSRTDESESRVSAERWHQLNEMDSASACGQLSLCVLFPKEEPYNYNKATILYS